MIFFASEPTDPVASEGNTCQLYGKEKMKLLAAKALLPSHLLIVLIFFSTTLIFIIPACGGGGGGGTDNADTSTTTTSTSTTTTLPASSSDSTSSSVPVPANYETILTRSLSLTPTSKSSVANRDRVLIQYNGLYMATNSSYEIELSASLSTYDDLMLKTFQLIEDSSASCYRLDSEKHSIYSVDYDSATNRLIMRNTWGYDRDSNSAYLCFTFDTAGNTMTAVKRYKFNTSSNTYNEDSSFTLSSVAIDGMNFILNSPSSSISLLNSGVDLSVPSDFNPSNTAFATNNRVFWTTSTVQSYSNHNLSGNKTSEDIHSKYQAQVSARGSDSGTSSAAETMLDQIKIDLENEGESLRYDPALYLAFRNGLLNTKLKGATIVNGQIDQNTAPYVFFTNESDDSDVKHPFMVVQLYSISDKPNRLLDVPTPPGDGTTPSYDTQQVTRDAILQTYTLKIPLKNYGHVSNLTENIMTNSLADDVNETNYTVYNYASISYIGIAIDGVVIYPPLNNTLTSTQKKAEIANMGLHVGRGMGLHWHADGHGATGNGLNLYNISDYAGNSHPPLIGFGMDGIALYGKYETAYSTMDGYGDELDNFGGHEHGSYGYHYHAHSASSSVLNDTVNYTLHILMKGAWKGSINNIPEFWAEAGQMNRYVGLRQYISN
ncbi:MAG: hypothetical protein HQM14_08225 [SAR324 cluster bacterium]|nr:hypothetical protein [SAR324 cluster bacterium]